MSAADPALPHDPSRAVAVLLAAGGGRRMGRPKALLALGGVPLALAVAARYAQCGVRPVLLVVGDDVRDLLSAAALRSELATSLEWVEGAPADAPMMQSVRRGLDRAMELGAELVFVQPVDAGPPLPSVLAALRNALGERQAAKPTHGGRGGHPVLLSAQACVAVLAGDAATLRDALAALGSDRIARVEVDDAGVLANWNRPGDLPEDLVGH